MIILQVNNVSKYYGAEAILSNIKLEVQTRDRIALVGRNAQGNLPCLKLSLDIFRMTPVISINPKMYLLVI